MAADSEQDDYKEKCKKCVPIAKPLSKKSTCKKILKLCKKAAEKKQLRRGVKEVVKSIRKQEKGLCILAGDVSPLDVISHIPVLCEDNDIPYIYVPSKEDLGGAGLSKRASSCMLILPKHPKGAAEQEANFTELYQECNSTIKSQLDAAVSNNFA